MRKREIFLLNSWKTEVLAYILYACSVPVVYLYGIGGSAAFAAETGVFLASGGEQTVGGVEIMRAPGISGLDAGDGAYGCKGCGRQGRPSLRVRVWPPCPAACRRAGLPGSVHRCRR